MFLQVVTTPVTISDMQLVDVFYGGLKILFLIGFFVYILFAVLMARQIEEMRQTLTTPLSPIIQIAGYVHLIFAILSFLFVFMYLQ